MTRKFFTVTFYSAALILVICAVMATLASFVLRDMKYYAELTLQQLEKNTGYTISIDDINWSITKGAGLCLDNVKVTDTRQNILVFSSKRVHLLTALSPLARKHLRVSRISFQEAAFFFVRDTDKRWNTLRLPAGALEDSAYKGGLFDFSLSLKRLFVENGSLHFRDRAAEVAYDITNITLQAIQDSPTQPYRIEAEAETGGKQAAGHLALAAELQILPSADSLQTVSARGSVTVRSLELAGFTPYLQRLSPLKPTGGSLDADLNFELRPEMLYTASGTLACSTLTVLTADGSPFSFDALKLAVSLTGDRETLRADRLQLSLPGNITITGSCSIADLGNQPPTMTVRFDAERFRLTGLTTLLDKAALPDAPFTDIMQRITGGFITLRNIYWRLSPGEQGDSLITALQGNLELNDVKIRTGERLPPITVASGIFELNHPGASGFFTARWLQGDTHLVRADVRSLFQPFCIRATVESICPSPSLQDMLSSNAPDASFLPLAGFITAKTAVSYCSGLEITSEIDLSGAAYQLAGTVTKPAGLHNTIVLSGTALHEPRQPFSFSCLFGTGLTVEGTVRGWPEALEAAGSYQAALFDIASLHYSALPPPLQVKGTLHGEGSFQIPAPGPKHTPLTGTLGLKNFFLGEGGSATPLITASITAAMNGQSVSIEKGPVSVGQSSFKVSGTLNRALPPEGDLSADGDFFDIDDFVDTVKRIQDIVQQGRGGTQTPDNADSSLFKRTNLNVDLRAKKVNFQQWNGHDSTSRFFYKNGAMFWDDVVINTDSGSVLGSVLYDFTDTETKRLELVARRSDVDFCWCVPGLQEKQTITGVTDLRGEFSSTFRQRSEIAPNMTGAFHITISRGEIKKLVLLSKILSLFDLKRLVQLKTPDLLATTMPFDVIDADFALQKGSMNTDNLTLQSPAMNMSMAGSINVEKSSVDLIVGVHLLPTIGKILGTIPIAKDIFTGQDKKFTIGYFHVVGPYEDPSVKPMPLKSISTPIKNIFKKLIGIPKDIIESALNGDRVEGR